MREARIARIEWVPRGQGGRMAPPVGPSYVAPAKFEAAASWPREAWSLVVEMVDRLDGSGGWLARVHFLVDDAPHLLLADRADFELYEGRRCVARGRILDDSESEGRMGEAGSWCPSPRNVDLGA